MTVSERVIGIQTFIRGSASTGHHMDERDRDNASERARFTVRDRSRKSETRWKSTRIQNESVTVIQNVYSGWKLILTVTLTQLQTGRKVVRNYLPRTFETMYPVPQAQNQALPPEIWPKKWNNPLMFKN